MNIGFDAKRAFHNGTGLGHYSRTLVRSLADYFPEHEYYLFNPKASSSFSLIGPHLQEVQPAGIFNRLFPSAWRSSRVKKDLRRLKIDLYHGLSHEIPVGIRSTGIKTVVTIHDLIHERFPEQYGFFDVKTYRRKFRYACDQADRVIAISGQTKRDIMHFYHTPEEKIRVCYQSCNPSFGTRLSGEEKAAVKKEFGLPDEYFLYVGSLIGRKNLLNICKALFLLRHDLNIPLVVIGDGEQYKLQVMDYLRQNGLEKKVIFLSATEKAKQSAAFRRASVFPAIYQSAIAMIYPSFFEGFGIPVLEALWSQLPVITSNSSCMPETGGPGSYYVDPASADEIATGMKTIYEDKAFAAQMRATGLEHAKQFTPQKSAAAVMEVYKECW
ncbi:MAG: glycosyltransferase family 4 protein [Sphingobacteriales bacterium]|nr:glycosyltransferase family 4 protein [Sphingobacteriales bacterium]